MAECANPNPILYVWPQNKDLNKPELFFLPLRRNSHTYIYAFVPTAGTKAFTRTSTFTKQHSKVDQGGNIAEC